MISTIQRAGEFKCCIDNNSPTIGIQTKSSCVCIRIYICSWALRAPWNDTPFQLGIYATATIPRNTQNGTRRELSAWNAWPMVPASPKTTSPDDGRPRKRRINVPAAQHLPKHSMHVPQHTFLTEFVYSCLHSGTDFVQISSAKLKISCDARCWNKVVLIGSSVYTSARHKNPDVPGPNIFIGSLSRPEELKKITFHDDTKRLV